ncbi:hypothetical protein D1872_345410 [compost metagenome]
MQYAANAGFHLITAMVLEPVGAFRITFQQVSILFLIFHLGRVGNITFHLTQIGFSLCQVSEDVHHFFPDVTVGL